MAIVTLWLFPHAEGTQDCAAAMQIARNSACPASRWMDVLAPLLAREEDMVFLNIGANKGYAIADFLQRFNASETLDNRKWLQRVKRHVHSTVDIKCGVCGACKNPVPTVRMNRTRTLRAYAVELITANVGILQWLYKYFNVNGQILHLAVTNESGFVYEPRNARPGTEWHSISTSGKRVRSVTVDDLLHETRLDEGLIDLLTIDAEGFDPLIIDGASKLLASKRARIVEFEYHRVGMWVKGRSLRTTLDQMYTAGYQCYWEGNDAVKGALAPAGGSDWCPEFEFRNMSNVLCASEPALTQQLDRLIPW